MSYFKRTWRIANSLENLLGSNKKLTKRRIGSGNDRYTKSSQEYGELLHNLSEILLVNTTTPTIRDEKIRELSKLTLGSNETLDIIVAKNLTDCAMMYFSKNADLVKKEEAMNTFINSVNSLPMGTQLSINAPHNAMIGYKSVSFNSRRDGNKWVDALTVWSDKLVLDIEMMYPDDESTEVSGMSLGSPHVTGMLLRPDGYGALRIQAHPFELKSKYSQAQIPKGSHPSFEVTIPALS